MLSDMSDTNDAENGRETTVRKRKLPLAMVFLACLLVISAFVSMFVGTLGPIGPGTPTSLSFGDAMRAILDPSNEWHLVFWEVRLPQILLAALVGAGLACAGTAMQAVFRNPLADPFIIGVSSGAALGAASAGLLGITAVATAFTRPLFAFVSALGTVFVVYMLGTVKGRVQVYTLLLSGVAVASFLGAIVSFLIYFAKQQYHELIFWLLGSLSLATWQVDLVLLCVVVSGVIIVFLYGRDLNALLLGEETAHSLGADPESLKKLMLGVAALMTAAAVAFTGIIGFVGLIVPHMMRLVFGANHRVLVPASALFGASFMIWSHAIAISVIAPTRLPVGIITALCGGPFFLYLLRRGRTGGEVK